MIRVLHRDGLVLELTAGGDRPSTTPLRIPDAIAARRLLTATTTDAVGQRVVRDLLAAAGEPSVAALEATAALDRLAVALAYGRVQAAIVRPRHTTDNVAAAPPPPSVPSVVAPPPVPGVSNVVAAVKAVVAAATAPPPGPAPYPEPAMTDLEQARYNALSPAARAFFDQALAIARTADVTTTNCVFWSDKADKIAAAYAKKQGPGFKSLEMTDGGMALSALFESIYFYGPEPAVTAVALEIRKANLAMLPWSIISARYGAQAHGEVTAFVTTQTRPNSVFFRVELPRALARGVTVVPTPGVVRDGALAPLAPQRTIRAGSANFQHLDDNPEAQRAVDFYTHYPPNPSAEQRATYSALTRHYDKDREPAPLTPADHARVEAILHPPGTPRSPSR